MKYPFIQKVLITLMALLLATGCSEEWLDVNTDPNNPQDATLALLLPSVQTQVGFRLSRDINENTMVFSRMMYILAESQYTQDPTTYSNDYDQLFLALKNNEEIIKLGTEQNAWEFVGIAKIMKAHVMGVMVDLFGDLPYQEAFNGEENLNPAFENSADIYQNLIALLDEGKAEFDKESEVPLAGDLIYGNDTDLWEKAANTIKLRMLLNLRLVDPANAAAGINALIQEGELISDKSEDFQFQFGSSLAPLNRHPIYQIDYAGAGNKTFYMSHYFMYNLIKKNDPRLPFYIYRQGTDADLNFETTPCSNRSDCVYGLLSTTDLGEAGEGYIGRDHGDPSGLPGDDEIRATWGVYPIGGSYDNNARRERTQGDGGEGAGIIPYVTNEMRAFMLAEAKLTLPGVTAGSTVEEYLEEGIRASMEKVETFSISIDQNSIPMDNAEVEDYVAARLSEYADAASADLKLNVIIKEKYFAQFGNGMEVFTDLRRTGFPADLPSSLAPAAPFPLRLPYSITELSTNSNAPSPPPTLDTPIFWDAN